MLYTFQCFRRGKLLWEKQEHNLIMADGLMDCLNQYIGGVNYQALFSMGLKDAGAPDILDTLAVHPSWTELTPYAGPRPPCFFGAWGSGVLGGCLGGPAIYNITAPATVGGAFLVSSSGKLVGAATTELDSMLPGEVDFFQGLEGIYCFNGDKAVKVSDPVDPIFKAGFSGTVLPVKPMDGTRREYAVMAIKHGRLYFFYPEWGATS